MGVLCLLIFQQSNEWSRELFCSQTVFLLFLWLVKVRSPLHVSLPTCAVIYTVIPSNLVLVKLLNLTSAK